VSLNWKPPALRILVGPEIKAKSEVQFPVYGHYFILNKNDYSMYGFGCQSVKLINSNDFPYSLYSSPTGLLDSRLRGKDNEGLEG
jgi:hypothetical protein